jgi:hypothetical protein
MPKFRASFVKKDGLDVRQFPGLFSLKAETVSEARDEALTISKPDGANFVQIWEEGRLIGDLGFGL